MILLGQQLSEISIQDVECGCLYLTIFYPSKTYNIDEVQLPVKDPFHKISMIYTMYSLWHSYDASDFFILCQLDLQYLHPHGLMDSSIGLNTSPQLELSTVVRSKYISMCHEVGFNTTSASFSKFNVGIAFNNQISLQHLCCKCFITILSWFNIIMHIIKENC